MNQTLFSHLSRVVRKSAKEGCRTRINGLWARRQRRRDMVCIDGRDSEMSSRLSIALVDSGALATRTMPRISRKSFAKSSSFHMAALCSAVLYSASSADSTPESALAHNSASIRLLGSCASINSVAVDAHTKSPTAFRHSASRTCSPGQLTSSGKYFLDLLI